MELADQFQFTRNWKELEKGLMVLFVSFKINRKSAIYMSLTTITRSCKTQGNWKHLRSQKGFNGKRKRWSSNYSPKRYLFTGKNRKIIDHHLEICLLKSLSHPNIVKLHEVVVGKELDR